MKKNTPGFDGRELLFSNQDLKKLILPLMGEQFLVMALGIADTIMIASVGEAAISAISLVNVIASLILYALSALCTGGAVVVSQYLGRKDTDSACKAADQLLIVSVGLMTFLTILFILFRTPLLHTVFGTIEPDVLHNAQTYWRITAFSFPFLAVYNAAGAIFRSTGNTKTVLNISLLMNALNILGNALLIYGVKMGVAGAATSTLFARAVAAVLAFYLLRSNQHYRFIHTFRHFHLDMPMVRSIFSVGIPSGLENGMVQFGKLITQSLISTLGTAALAANAVLNNIGTITFVPSTAFSLAVITVIGRCVGAKEYEQAQYYTRKLVFLSFVAMAIVNFPMIFISEPLAVLFNLGTEATEILKSILPLLSIVHIFAWSMAFTLPNTLRAAGDVKVTMFISLFTMFVIRIGCSFILVLKFDCGVAGVWYAMMLDGIVRMCLFVLRYNSGKWKSMNVIKE